MSAEARLYVVPTSSDLVFDVEAAKPLIPDAIYSAICTGCDAKIVFQTMKVFVRFRITEGEHTGVELARPYRAKGKILPGKGPGSGPRPRINRSGDLYRMLCRVLGLPANTKAHRLSFRELEGKVFRIKTRTVVADSKQRTLAASERYSVVEDVLNIEAG